MSSSKKKFSKKQLFLKKIRTFLSSKKTVLLLVAVGVSLSTFIGTFAWFTSSDKQVNAFEGTHLVAQIDETFTPKIEWAPGEQATKEVRIENTGETPAIVRVSLYEFLLNFQIDTTDQTGNGNLKTVKQAVTPSVDGKDTDTWTAAAQAHGTYQQGDQYYVANQAWVSDPNNQTGMYEYGGTQQQTVPYKFITLNFTEQLKTTVDSSATTDYWLYDAGYFYYSRPLQPGERSTDLLKSVTLAETIPNAYKGALYKIKVYMDAHDVTEPILSAWNLNKESPAYTLIESQLN